MVYNFNRLFVGILIVLVLIITYFFQLDVYFFAIVITFIFYEFYKSIILDKFLILFLFIALLIQIFFTFFILDNYLYIISLTILSLIFSLISSKYYRFFFIFFIINILTLLVFLFNIDRNIIYLIIIISFLNDTVAYLSGSFIKGPLISPGISPKKTWSGTSISFLFTTSILISLDFNLLISSIMSLSLFYGDLYFSYIKRKLQIKDFSNTLLSHGGILDRIDSITFLIFIFGVINL